MSPLKTIPSPPRTPLLGNLLDMRQPTKFLMSVAQEYGGLVALRFWSQAVLLVSDPAYVKHILQDNARNYIRGENLKTARLLLGNGLATVDGDSWFMRRRLMQPAFHRRRLTQLIESINSTVEKHISYWQPLLNSGQSLDLAEEMMRLTLTVIVKTMFSLDDEATIKQLADAFNFAQRFIYGRSYSLFNPPRWLPTPNNRRFDKALSVLDGIIYKLIANRRQQPNAHNDLLAMLLEARDEETGEGMSDEALRDEIITLFFAGHETTATALAWTWYILLSDTKVATCFAEEIEHAAGNHEEENGRFPTATTLTQLHFTDRLLQESMRLYTPIWIFARETVSDDVIDGFPIPAGTPILLSPYVTHHTPELWPTPFEFDADRFLPAAVNERHRFAYYPFGGGTHLCIGQNLAMMEAKIILTQISQTYRLSLLPNHPIETKPEVTLRPKHGIRVYLRSKQ